MRKEKTNKIICPICGQNVLAKFQVWDLRSIGKCCEVTVIATEESRTIKAEFNIGKFKITGTKERVRVQYGRDHQIIQTDVNNFIGIEESTLELIYESARWSLLEKTASMR